MSVKKIKNSILWFSFVVSIVACSGIRENKGFKFVNGELTLNEDELKQLQIVKEKIEIGEEPVCFASGGEGGVSRYNDAPLFVVKRDLVHRKMEMIKQIKYLDSSICFLTPVETYQGMFSGICRIYNIYPMVYNKDANKIGGGADFLFDYFTEKYINLAQFNNYSFIHEDLNPDNFLIGYNGEVNGDISDLKNYTAFIIDLTQFRLQEKGMFRPNVFSDMCFSRVLVTGATWFDRARVVKFMKSYEIIELCEYLLSYNSLGCMFIIGEIFYKICGITNTQIDFFGLSDHQRYEIVNKLIKNNKFDYLWSKYVNISFIKNNEDLGIFVTNEKLKEITKGIEIAEKIKFNKKKIEDAKHVIKNSLYDFELGFNCISLWNEGKDYENENVSRICSRDIINHFHKLKEGIEILKSLKIPELNPVCVEKYSEDEKSKFLESAETIYKFRTDFESGFENLNECMNSEANLKHDFENDKDFLLMFDKSYSERSNANYRICIRIVDAIYS